MIQLVAALLLTVASPETNLPTARDYISVQPVWWGYTLEKHGQEVWPGFLGGDLKDAVVGVPQAELHADRAVWASEAALGLGTITVGLILASAIHDRHASESWPAFSGQGTTSLLLNVGWVVTFVGELIASEIARNQMVLATGKYNEAIVTRFSPATHE